MQRAKPGAGGFCYRASEVFGGIQITEELWNQSAHQNVFVASWNDVWAIVNVSFSLSEWQAVKMIFFAPCYGI